MKSGTTGSGEECRHVNQETGTMKIGRWRAATPPMSQAFRLRR
jgi:hypothetical protein